MSYNKGDYYIYCDICGQRHYASRTTKLSHYTGREGLIVCPYDVDKIDPGLIPFTPRKEKIVSNIRINHANTANSSPIFDYEVDTVENISSYQYLMPSQYDNVVLTLSQDEDIWIATSQEI